MALKGIRRTSRRLLAPEFIEQRERRDRGTGSESERGDDGSELLTWNIDGNSMIRNGQWSE
ncbi:hypothetical protein SLNWT_4931 [Streptomyces albus]|uniref:Uncharacterized protein n=1 Tax=Streptomyces albus (strain ATCC 21838 / DSM 41398 / FERM P-419 / JCM 4703 / NBRC 107858) TaxID=1081613 RepID=A0A0B5F4Q9_STRA4|nr:hypothetical protein SLNWT_4931 [Streptomyces albus]AOU79614.1 hypothetical protein SLNHY_4923 [Streptomyces albus]AYN35336.1 hypothetical protein DUI70_4839 [Streptomyces albus]